MPLSAQQINRQRFNQVYAFRDATLHIHRLLCVHLFNAIARRAVTRNEMLTVNTACRAESTEASTASSSQQTVAGGGSVNDLKNAKYRYFYNVTDRRTNT